MSTSVNPSSKHPLDGARERLKRADENIRNLNTEVDTFLAGLPRVRFEFGKNNIIISDKDREAYEKLRDHALAQTAIPRLGVLAGEIVHHFRCAFDHLIWQLADSEAQRRFAKEIEFPICETSPECFIRESDRKVKHSAYCRKVQGVSSLTALARIHSLQPYIRSDVHNSPLLQIHVLDKFDKHRELVDVIRAPYGRAVANSRQTVHTVKDSASGGFRIVGGETPKVDVYAEMFLDVAFTQLRQWESQPLIPSLKNLLSFTSDTIESFADEF